jgi:hypothetical protein
MKARAKLRENPRRRTFTAKWAPVYAKKTLYLLAGETALPQNP